MDDQTPQSATSTITTATREFFGSFSHSIDAKGRIIIPNTYRDALGITFTIGPTQDFTGIALYPNEIFNRIRDELNAMNQRKQAVQKYTEQFFKLSYRDMQADTQGRILLPTKLRQRILKEAKDLEISGASEFVRIKDAQMADEADMDFMANREQYLDALAELDP